jgi:histidyl-tRNA synthetase
MDAEHIIMCADLWRRLGLADIALQINTLGSPEARARHRTRLIHYLEQHVDALDEDARRRLHSNPLRILDSKNPALAPVIDQAPKLLEDLDEAALLHFEHLQEILRAAGVDYEINPRLVRGLDYYNFTVFEWVTTRLGAQGTVCAGGRYDGLVQQLGGKGAPACGFAMGVERLLALLQENGFAPAQRGADAYVVHQGEQADLFAWQVAQRLREAGLDAILHCGGGGFKAQMKKADASGARFAVIIGDDEAQAGEVSMKPLRELEEQVRVPLQQAIDLIRQPA